MEQAGNGYNSFMAGYLQLSRQSTAVDMEEKLLSFVQRHFLEERKSSRIARVPLEDEHFRVTNSAYDQFFGDYRQIYIAYFLFEFY